MREAPESDRSSPLEDVLRAMTRFVSRRPAFTLGSALCLSLAAIALTGLGLEFHTRRSDLIDPNTPFHRRWLNYTKSFGDSSEMVVVVEADDPEIIKAALDDLGERVVQEPERFANVLFRIEPGRLPAKGLQYLSPRELEAGLMRLERYAPLLEGRWELAQLESLVPRLTRQIAERLPASSAEAAEGLGLLNHAERLSVSLAGFVADPDGFSSPWPDLLPVDRRLLDEARQVVYLMNDEGTVGFLKAVPVEDDASFAGPTASIERMRELMAEVARRHPNATFGLTGIPVLESDEMRRSQSDMWQASIISFLGVGVLLVVGFRGVKHPVVALVMLAVGMAWAFGFATLAVGHLNILSVSFAAILIGLGIDFAIHYLARYLELRHEGRPLRPALMDTSASVGTGIVAAAVTTALAFFSASLTEFVGVAELGIIAGGGILLCVAATFLVVPATLSLADRHIEPKKLPAPFQGTWLRLLIMRQPAVILGSAIVTVVWMAGFAVQFHEGHLSSRVHYDPNLLNLQADGLESVEVQQRIFRKAGSSLLFAVSLAETPEQARELRRRFAALPTVHHVEELASRLPAVPAEQTRLLVQAYRARLAHLPPAIPVLRDPDPAVIGRELENLYLTLRKLPQPQARRSAQALDQFLDRLERYSLADQILLLKQFDHRSVAALLAQLKAIAAASDPEPVTLDDLPQALTSRYVSPEGQWLVQVFPKEQIWDLEPLTRFVEDVRSVDPQATGTPLQNFEAARQIRESYESAALYALVAIAFVLLIDALDRRHVLPTLFVPALAAAVTWLAARWREATIDPVVLGAGWASVTLAMAWLADRRSVRDTALALLPPLAGGAMMFGCLALLGVQLNPANLIVLPLVLGIGVDDGVHVIHDFRHQRGRYRMSSSTINGIVLTSLTSMIGFGSMLIAAHRGLYSLGLVLVVGVACCLFVSLVPLPAILTLIDRSRARRTRRITASLPAPQPSAATPPAVSPDAQVA